MAAETETPGFSRLMELLQGSYLRKGVRKSVASKLEEVSIYTYKSGHHWHRRTFQY